jgi:O-antigen ligase
MLLVGAMKHVAGGSLALGLQYIATALIYLTVFGFYLPKSARGFDLRSGVLSIGLANILILALNYPTILMPGAYSGIGRFTGIAANSNQLAYGLALTSVCLPSVIGRIRWRIVSWGLLLGLLVLNFQLVTLTLSRGAFVLTILSICASIYIFLGRRGRLLLLLAPPAAIGGYAYLTQLALYDAIFSGRLNTRDDVFERQITRFLDYPLFGGLWLEGRVVSGENMFFGAATEFGVLGLIFTALLCLPLLVRFVRKGWLMRLPDGDERVIARTAAAFVLLTIVSSTLESLLLGGVGPIILAFLMLDASSQSRRRGSSATTFTYQTDEAHRPYSGA